MRNLNQLEREWRQYKNKQRRPYFIALIVTILSLGALFFVLNQEDKPLIEKSKKASISSAVEPSVKDETTPPARIKPELNSSMEKVAQPTQKILHKQELLPSFSFMKQINEERYTPKEKSKKKSVKSKTTQPEPKIKRTTQRDHRDVKNTIEVTSTSSKNKIYELAKRFNTDRNPLLGIAVAKQYLQSKQYKKAYFYALEVNNIDRNNEDSWLVSAQALYYLKKRNDALKLLESYLQKNSSIKAQRLYRAIKQGHLK